MYGIWKYFALVLLLLTPAAFSLSINEVMYNPNGTDTGNEWIEIYNNDAETYNLTGWVLNTGGVNHILRIPPLYGGRGTMLLSPGEYIIISNDAPTFISTHSFSGTVIHSSYSLPNSENETLLLSDGSFVYATLTYYPVVDEGHTVCLVGNYYECIETPGTANILYVRDTVIPSVYASISPSSPFVNQTFVINASAEDPSLTSIEIFLDGMHSKTCTTSNPTASCSYSGKVHSSGTHSYYAIANDSYGNSGGTVILNFDVLPLPTDPVNDTNTTTCDVSSFVSTEKDVYDQGDVIFFAMQINDSNCQAQDVYMEYWIEDLYGNIVKPALNNTYAISCTSINRQWSPPFGQTQGYLIRANVNPGCNDTNGQTNNATKLVVVRGNASVSQEKNQSSNIEIKNFSDASFGEAVTIDLAIYRGNTSKYAVEIWIQSQNEKISAVSSFHADSRFINYNITLPVQIKPNCDSKFQNGTYTLVAEGLDKNATTSINVSGIISANCKTTTVTVYQQGQSSSSSSCATAAPVSVAANPYEMSYPILVKKGNEFTTTVKITNNGTKQKTYMVYTYVFKGSNPVSEGYNEKERKWYSTYNANSRNITINASSSALISMLNRIENETLDGIYSLRARIKTDGKDNDVTKDIVVANAERPEKQCPSMQVPLPTVKAENASSGMVASTGMLVKRSNFRYIFSSPFALLMNSLFKL